MPGRDGTGPRGTGPMTGWGAGDCAPGAAGTETRTPFFARWGGRGRRSRLWGRRAGAFYGAGQPWGAPAEPAMPDQEIGALERQSGWLQEQLGAIEERLAALKAGRDTGAGSE